MLNPLNYSPAISHVIEAQSPEHVHVTCDRDCNEERVRKSQEEFTDLAYRALVRGIVSRLPFDLLRSKVKILSSKIRIGGLERRVKISLYLHAWQGVLMFLMGIVCVLASFGGYVLSGGGEELLRRALLNVTSGKATYDSLRVNWRSSRIEVSNIRHEDFSWPKDNPIAELKNIQAEKLFVQLEGWPARVESITVQGLTGVPGKRADGTAITARPTIHVSDGFLQQGKFPEKNPPKDLPRIQFVNCELDVKLSDAKALEMSGCKGELARDGQGRLRGGFSLSKLNDKPFELTLETLEDGRWVVTGKRIQLDTATALDGSKKNPFASKIDPVGVLIQSLFSGEMGAHGMLTSLHVAVQPARVGLPFYCEGDVGYSNLTLYLLPPEGKSGKAFPFYMAMLLGVDGKQNENWLPRMLQVEQITTGAMGWVSFHMNDGRLDFSCDEGLGSALTGVRDGVPLPALESLKGSVETDASNLPKRIVLRGFVGSEVSFETRIALEDDRSRTTELLLLPRSGDSSHLNFGRPLWRFESRVKDYVSVANRAADLALAEFEVESTIQSTPLSDWLPMGIKQFSGRIHAKGGFHNLNGKASNGRKLAIDELSWDNGAIVYGGAEQRKVGAEMQPFWEALHSVFATSNAATIHGLQARATAEVYFDENLEWWRLHVGDGTLKSAWIEGNGDMTAIAPPELKLLCDWNREVKSEIKSADVSIASSDWSVALKGGWVQSKSAAPTGEFKYSEKNVPLNFHPARGVLGGTAAVQNGRVHREMNMQVRTDGVKVEAVK